MRGTDSRDEWATLSMPKCFQARRENPCPALRMQKNDTSALGSLQLLGEADLDTTNLLQWLRVRNVLVRCTPRALGVTGGAVERLQMQEKRRLLGGNGFGTSFEDGWGVYRWKWGQKEEEIA